MVAVVKEELGVEEFKAYWPLEIYLDKSRGFYADLHNGKENSASFFSLFKSGPRNNMSRASGKGFQGNMKGEGFVLGGLGIYEKEKGVIYEHAESEFGDHAPLAGGLDSNRQTCRPSHGAFLLPDMMAAIKMIAK